MSTVMGHTILGPKNGPIALNENSFFGKNIDIIFMYLLASEPVENF